MANDRSQPGSAGRLTLAGMLADKSLPRQVSKQHLIELLRSIDRNPRKGSTTWSLLAQLAGEVERLYKARLDTLENTIAYLLGERGRQRSFTVALSDAMRPQFEDIPPGHRWAVWRVTGSNQSTAIGIMGSGETRECALLDAIEVLRKTIGGIAN